MQRYRRNPHAPLRQVTLENGLYELLAPHQARLFGRRQKREREPAPAPERGLRVGSDFEQTESADLETLGPTGKAFRALPHEFARGATQDEEAGRRRATIDEHSEDGEEFRAALHLVDDDQPGQRSKRGFRFIEAGDPQRIFEIELVRRILAQQLPCESRLAALMRSGEHDDRRPRERLTDSREVMLASELHGKLLTMIFPCLQRVFHGYWERWKWG